MTDRVDIAHPTLPGQVVSVPAESLHHHERAGWFRVLELPADDLLVSDDNPEGEPGETGQSPEQHEELA